MMFCVSQKPVIITSTWARSRPLLPRSSSRSGCFFASPASTSHTSDSDTLKT